MDSAINAASRAGAENGQLALDILACDSASGHVPRATTSTDDATVRITPLRHRPNGTRTKRARRDRVERRLRESALRLIKRGRPVLWVAAPGMLE